MLKRQNRRVYLVAFLDDHSRFVVAYGLHASQSTALVLEVLEAANANHGPPEKILTDNGAQYVTWRGKSRFTKRLEQRGIRQLVSRPQRPQTLGKIERFWGTLWREFLESAVFVDLDEARRRIGHFIDYYNFQRPHRGVGGLVPGDRFFQAALTVLQTLKERVAANALELARYGAPVGAPPLSPDARPAESAHRERANERSAISPARYGSPLRGRLQVERSRPHHAPRRRGTSVAPADSCSRSAVRPFSVDVFQPRRLSGSMDVKHLEDGL